MLDIGQRLDKSWDTHIGNQHHATHHPPNANGPPRRNRMYLFPERRRSAATRHYPVIVIVSAVRRLSLSPERYPSRNVRDEMMPAPQPCQSAAFPDPALSARASIAARSRLGWVRFPPLFPQPQALREEIFHPI